MVDDEFDERQELRGHSGVANHTPNIKEVCVRAAFGTNPQLHKITIQKRVDGWYYASPATQQNQKDAKGPFQSLGKAAQSIAQELVSSQSIDGRCED